MRKRKSLEAFEEYLESRDYKRDIATAIEQWKENNPKQFEQRVFDCLPEFDHNYILTGEDFQSDLVEMLDDQIADLVVDKVRLTFLLAENPNED